MHTKKNKLLYSLGILFVLFLQGSILLTHGKLFVMAAPASQNLTDASNNLIQIVLTCEDENNNSYYLHQGSGFLISNTSDGQYILTDSNVVTASEDELDNIRKWNGLGTDDKLTPQICLLLPPDIYISASIVSHGTDYPYALLTPATTLNRSGTLKLQSISNASRNDTAYLYGYHQDLSFSPLELYTGRITSVGSDPFQITCNINAPAGAAGAPLFDGNGAVLGMFYYADRQCKVLPSDIIIEILTALNIDYQTAGSVTYHAADKIIRQYLIEIILFGILSVCIILHIRQIVKARNMQAELHPENNIVTQNSPDKKVTAALIRSDTGEVIWLDKPELRIGKEKRQVDYCISGYPGISRYHAAIVYRDRQYYVIDNKSTNHTYINHTSIRPLIPVLLNDQDSLAFADISFQFRII